MGRIVLNWCLFLLTDKEESCGQDAGGHQTPVPGISAVHGVAGNQGRELSWGVRQVSTRPHAPHGLCQAASMGATRGEGGNWLFLPIA